VETWREKLMEGDAQLARDMFVDRYRRLIIATIRRTVVDRETVADVFADVCAKLSADELALLKRHDVDGKAQFSTWLVTVVHHQSIDWLRREQGRRRVKPPAGLTAIQEQIFKHVFGDRLSHAEAYEIIRADISSELSFGAFLKEVAETYRVIERARGRAATRYFAGPPPVADQVESDADDGLAATELRRHLAEALESLPAEERLALQLFIIDDLPAARVARLIGWPNAKAVYNRVYRALGALRKQLDQQRIGPSDF
jgi:RNA polymerase sigma factor (sigma-70 family)